MCDFFEFSNEDRLRILYKLNEPLTAVSISRELDPTT